MKMDLFRTDVARGGGVRIDRENAIIKGFAVVTKGITKDERGEFDDEALESIVSLGNQAKLGVKSRFGHPNMSSTALGTFLGRVKNFLRDGNIVRADLHIDKTAFDTPDGDLAGYVLNLAQSDPEMFGASMVIHWDAEERNDLEAGEENLPPFIRVTKLLSVDVVDDPAANNGFFGHLFFRDSVIPSSEMTLFLDKFLNNPDAVEKTIGFLDRYRFNKETKNKEQSIMSDLTLEQFKEQNKGIYESVQKEGLEAGVKQERERSVEILKKAKAFEGMDALALEAVEQGKTVDQAVISFQEKRLEDLKDNSAPQVGPDDEEEPKKGLSHFDRAKAYQKEHGGSMTDALRATAEKR
jgi:hypothetical protein